MKYSKPYYADDLPLSEKPFPGVEIGLALFLRIFKNEIKDMETWRQQPSTAQLLLERSSWLYWHSEEAEEIARRARPFIALFKEAYAKDPKNAVQICNEIMTSYAEIQHSAYSRDYTPGKNDDYVREFNHFFDEYRFRYEELLNRLVSVAYACIEIINGSIPLGGVQYINIDTNPKVRKINASSLPSAMSYENIHACVAGVQPGIRNALSHGGRRTPVPDTKKFQLQDSSGWKGEYTLEDFRNELDILNRTIVSLEFASLVIHMNYVRDFAGLRKELPNQFSQEEKSQVMYTAARDCELQMIDAESKPPFFEVNVRFAPVQPRESELFGYWEGAHFSRKIPARAVDLKGQVFRFIHYVLPILEEDIPSIKVTVHHYGEKILARATIEKLKEFDEAAKEIKGYDDYATKDKIEKEYVQWERVEWAVGEIGLDGKPIQ